MCLVFGSIVLRGDFVRYTHERDTTQASQKMSSVNKNPETQQSGRSQTSDCDGMCRFLAIQSSASRMSSEPCGKMIDGTNP